MKLRIVLLAAGKNGGSTVFVMKRGAEPNFRLPEMECGSGEEDALQAAARYIRDVFRGETNAIPLIVPVRTNEETLAAIITLLACWRPFCEREVGFYEWVSTGYVIGDTAEPYPLNLAPASQEVIRQVLRSPPESARHTPSLASLIV